MRNVTKNLFGWLMMLAALAPAARPAESIKITEYAQPTQKPVPIALAGYSGDVLNVLKFDLFVVGFTVVAEDQAQYTLRGAGGGQVEGRLTDNISKAVKFAKAYSGGSPRTQAHALADDTVEAVTGKKGIGRTKIAFKVKRGELSEMYVSDYDGFGAAAITADNSLVASPSWGVGNRMLFYSTWKLGNADIVAHNLAGSDDNRKVVARYTGSNLSPAVSPDGRKLAMILSKGGSPDLYVADIDGGNLRQVTQTREDESSPTWSPDGRTLCYATKMDGRRVLATVPAGGGTPKRLVTAGVANPSEPDWSPDGKEIAFTSQMRGFEICVVPAAGGEARVLVSGEDPSWAPNSRTLVFMRRTSGGRRGLSLLDAPTKQLKDVPQNLGICSQPAWSR